MGFLFIFLFLSELLAIILTPAKQLAFAKDIKWYKRITSIDGDVETLNNKCILNWDISVSEKLSMHHGEGRQ